MKKMKAISVCEVYMFQCDILRLIFCLLPMDFTQSASSYYLNNAVRDNPNLLFL